METEAPFVLIAEDMPAVAEPLAFALRHAGFDVAVAANGLEVLERIDERKPDVILLDLAMPRMDGLACLRNIRQSFKKEELPVIVLSANSEQELVVEAARLGVAAYLLKSTFSLRQLVELVGKVLGTEGREMPRLVREGGSGVPPGTSGSAAPPETDGSGGEPESARGPVISRFASGSSYGSAETEAIIPQQ